MLRDCLHEKMHIVPAIYQRNSYGCTLSKTREGHFLVFLLLELFSKEQVGLNCLKR